MTAKQYNFYKNTRIIAIVASAAALVFIAGAIFTGYKLTLGNYLVIVILVINLVNAIINKPTPPYEQIPGKTPENQ